MPRTLTESLVYATVYNSAGSSVMATAYNQDNRWATTPHEDSMAANSCHRIFRSSDIVIDGLREGADPTSVCAGTGDKSHARVKADRHPP